MRLTRKSVTKLKTEEKDSSSFQFKGNKLQFEFNSSLLDSINSASTHLLEGKRENAKTLLNKGNKVIRFADKSPAGWTAVEGYESDELADDSDDEKKLRSAERRALTRLRARKQNRSSAQDSSLFAGSSLHRATAQPFRPQQFPQQQFRPQSFRSRQPQPSDKCFSCGQFWHWANSPFCSNDRRLYSNRALPSTPSASDSK